MRDAFVKVALFTGLIMGLVACAPQASPPAAAPSGSGQPGSSPPADQPPAQPSTAAKTPAVTLVSGQKHPISLLLDSTHVYWANKGDGSIMRASKDGGAATALVTGQAQLVSLIRVDDASVYWATSCAVTTTVAGRRTCGGLMKLPKAGGDPTALTTLTSPTDGPFAADTTHIYWLQQMPGAIMRVPLAGGNPERVGEATATSGTSMIVDSANIYWARHDERISRLPKDGRTPDVELARAQGRPFQLALDASNLYWGTGGAVRRMPREGGEPVVLADNQNTDIVAIDDGHIYWAGPRGVYKAPKNGGAPVELQSQLDAQRAATQAGQPRAPSWSMSSIAVDGSSVYYTFWPDRDQANGSILKAAK